MKLQRPNIKHHLQLRLQRRVVDLGVLDNLDRSRDFRITFRMRFAVILRKNEIKRESADVSRKFYLHLHQRLPERLVRLYRVSVLQMLVVSEHQPAGEMEVQVFPAE